MLRVSYFTLAVGVSYPLEKKQSGEGWEGKEREGKGERGEGSDTEARAVMGSEGEVVGHFELKDFPCS